LEAVVAAVVVAGTEVDWYCSKTKHYGDEMVVDSASEVGGYRRLLVFAGIDSEVYSMTKPRNHALSEDYAYSVLVELGFVVDLLYEARLYARQVLQCRPRQVARHVSIRSIPPHARKSSTHHG